MSEVKNILVTGGAGYIGSHTVVELIENGYTPIILDDFRNSDPRIIKGIETITNKEVIVRNVDVCNTQNLKEIFNEFNFLGIIHFAAYKAVGESVDKPLAYYRNNLMGLINCLELAIEYKVENFVFSSSCTVYGEPEGEKIVSETTKTQVPKTPYGNSKAIGERIIQDVIDSGANLRILNLRYFNPVGAHESILIGELPLGRPNNLLPILTQSAMGKLGTFVVNGNDYNTIDGTCVRDYIHVSDVADAHVKGLSWLEGQKKPMAEVINIGTGKGSSVLEIIHIFEDISGLELNWRFGDRRQGDIEEIYADVEKSNSVLKWKSKRSIRDAVIGAWNWELKLKNES